MLEDMLSEYDHTQSAFGTIVNAALGEIQCRDELKAELREAAKCVYRADWPMVRHYNLDRLFLAWLCGSANGWLYRQEPVDHHLPATVLVGLENLGTAPAEAAERRRRESARRVRIDRCASFLRLGWTEDEAVTFVCSREEWAEAKRMVGKVAA